MINRLITSADSTHYLGAVLKCALLLIFFTFGVEVYAQSYNMSESYRIGGSTQPTLSATQQWGGYGVANKGYHAPNEEGGQVIGYQSYQPTIFKPFDNTPPSRISSRRNSEDWEGGDVDMGEWGDETDIRDPGNQSGDSPVGEPWILLLFAAVAAAVVAWRQKKPIPALSEGKEI